MAPHLRGRCVLCVSQSNRNVFNCRLCAPAGRSGAASVQPAARGVIYRCCRLSGAALCDARRRVRGWGCTLLKEKNKDDGDRGTISARAQIWGQPAARGAHCTVTALRGHTRAAARATSRVAGQAFASWRFWGWHGRCFEALPWPPLGTPQPPLRRQVPYGADIDCGRALAPGISW